jgi:hypothetical protein
MVSTLSIPFVTQDYMIKGMIVTSLNPFTLELVHS